MWLRLTACEIDARSAYEFIEGVRVGGGGPEFGYLAVAQVHDVRVVGRHAPAAPAGRGDRQRDAVLVVRQDRVDVDVERSSVTSMSLAKYPKTASRPR